MRNKKERTVTTKELPHTRRELFWDLVKTQKRQMVSLSLLLFVFLLPLVVDILLFGMFIVSVPFDDPNYSSVIFSLIFYMMVISIPCVVIAFLGLGGLASICKNIAWQNGVINAPDFFYGIKKNYKHSLIFGVIFSLSLFLLVVGIFFLLRTREYSDMPWIFSVGIGLCITQFIVLSIVCAYALVYGCYYENSFREVFRNSFIFFVAKFFKNLGLFALTTGLIVGIMFVDFIAQIVIILVVAFLSSYMMIAWTLLGHEAFDQYINATNYPDYFRKGLYISENSKEEK